MPFGCILHGCSAAALRMHGLSCGREGTRTLHLLYSEGAKGPVAGPQCEIGKKWASFVATNGGEGSTGHKAQNLRIVNRPRNNCRSIDHAHAPSHKESSCPHRHPSTFKTAPSITTILPLPSASLTLLYFTTRPPNFATTRGTEYHFTKRQQTTSPTKIRSHTDAPPIHQAASFDTLSTVSFHCCERQPIASPLSSHPKYHR